MVADLKVRQGVGMLIIGGLRCFRCVYSGCISFLTGSHTTLVQRIDGGREEYLVLGGQIVFVQVKVHLFDRGFSCTGGVHMKVGPS